MRKKIWIPCVVVLLFCLLVFLWKTSESGKIVSPEQTQTATNQPSWKAKQIPTNRIKPRFNADDLVPAYPSNRQSSFLENSNARYQQVLNEWQAPIEFYGKVVDENTNPIAGANVQFSWTEIPAGNELRSATQSDSQGLFSLHGKRGPTLDVAVGKAGYYTPRPGFQGFSYALGGEKFSPDSANPIIFMLRKKGHGEPLIEEDFPPGMGQIAQLRHDGTPMEIDLFHSQKVEAGTGQLKLELWRDISQKNARIFDWKLQLSIPGGGLIRTDEEFAFEAPLNGYQSSLMIEMPASDPNWRDNITTKFYVRLPNGSYCRIDFYLLAYNGVFTIHSAINPSGSRGLEPAQ